MKKDTLKTLIMCAFGSIFEWYDFTIFGILAPVLSKIFFPTHTKITALLLTFTIFATGFIMRPVGSVFFGHIGDKQGRKKAIVISILLMTTVSVGIGLLPTVKTNHYCLMALLLGLRLLQGFAVSGEYSGLITFIAETVPAKHYYFWQSFNAIGSLGGVLLGTAIGGLTLSLPYTNAWRLPFLLSLVLGLIGLYLRMKASETAIFSSMVKQRKKVGFPFMHTIRHYKRFILLLICIVAIDTSGFYFVAVYYPSFLVHLGLSESHYLHATTLGLFIVLIITPLIGLLADKINLVKVLSVGIIAYIIIPIPTLKLINYDHFLSFWGQLLLFIPVVLVDPIVVAAAPRLFPDHVRYTGVAISISVVVCLFGGTTPLISTYLIHKTHSNIAPAIYLACIAVVSLVALHLGKRNLQCNQITS